MIKKILVINFGGLGDQILFFPVLKTLKQVFKASFITLVTEPRSKSAINLTGEIDELFISNLKYGNKLLESFKLIKKAFSGNYELVVSSGSSKLIAVLLFLTGIKERIGYDSGILSRILLTKAVPLEQSQYAANMYHDLVSSIEGSAEAGLPEIKISLDEPKKKDLEDLILKSNAVTKKQSKPNRHCEEHPQGATKQSIQSTNSDGLLHCVRNDTGKIVVHPGVSKLSIEKNIIKFWHEDNWAEFIKKLLAEGKYTVILTGGPDDRETWEKVKEKIKGHNPEYLMDLSEKTFGIDEFAYIVQLSDMLVCVDSAPMHIAVGLKKQVIALFGPTDQIKLLPSGNPLFTALKNSRANCRPCLWDRRQASCETMDCLHIEVDRVFDAVKEKLINIVTDK